jgi:hypothetical protein
MKVGADQFQDLLKSQGKMKPGQIGRVTYLPKECVKYLTMDSDGSSLRDINQAQLDMMKNLQELRGRILNQWCLSNCGSFSEVILNGSHRKAMRAFCKSKSP